MASAVVSLAIVARLGLATAARPFGYDDGVYGTSVLGMRHGDMPYRDVFSSQGPVFLPVLWFFDLIGGRGGWAPRLAMIVAGATVTAAVWMIAGRHVDRLTAGGLAAVVATSYSGILASGPLQSDGVALAFGSAAVAVAARAAGAHTPLTAGILTALALGTKSVHAVPAALSVGVLLRARGHRLGRAAAAAVATGAAVTIPFGWGRVWDQSVGFQASVPRSIDPLANLAVVWDVLSTRDLALLLLATASLVWLVAHRRAPNRPPLMGAASVWLAGALAILLFGGELGTGNLRFVALLGPPVALLGASTRVARGLVLVVASTAVLQLAVNADAVSGRFPSVEEGEAVAMLTALPEEAWIITDDQALAWMAERRVPGPLVDTSLARIAAGSLTTDAVVVAASDPQVCGVLWWSGRFDVLDPHLEDRLIELGFTETRSFGGPRRWRHRSACSTLSQR